MGAGGQVPRVAHDSDGGVPRRCASPHRLRSCVAALGRGLREGQRGSGRGSGCQILPRIARPPSGWWLRIQAQVSQDLLDHRPLKDGRDDLQFPGAAVWAVLRIDVKDTLELVSFVLARPWALAPISARCTSAWLVRAALTLPWRGHHASRPCRVERWPPNLPAQPMASMRH